MGIPGKHLDPSVHARIKKEFLAVYGGFGGNLSDTADAFGIDRHGLSDLIARDKELAYDRLSYDKRRVDAARRRAFDIADGTIKGNIGGPAFVLKAKDGWTDRQEVTHKGAGFQMDDEAPTPITLDGGAPPDTPVPHDGTMDGCESTDNTFTNTNQTSSGSPNLKVVGSDDDE